MVICVSTSYFKYFEQPGSQDFISCRKDGEPLTPKKRVEQILKEQAESKDFSWSRKASKCFMDS